MTTDEILSSLWGFVHGEMTLLRFEEIVYGEAATLRTIFPEKTVRWLLELDYREVEVAPFRFEVGTALSTVALGCACLRFPAAAKSGRDYVFFPEPISSAFSFVEQHIAKNLALIGKDPWYSRLWEDAQEAESDGAFHLHDGHFYCCRACGSSFLIVLDETNLEYLVLAVSARELGESTPQLLRKRFASDFAISPGGVEKVSSSESRLKES